MLEKELLINGRRMSKYCFVKKKKRERERKRKKEALCWVLEGRWMSVKDWGKGPAKQRSGGVTPRGGVGGEEMGEK